MSEFYLFGYLDKSIEEHMANRYNFVLERGVDDIIFSPVDQALSRRDNPEFGNTDAGLDLPFMSYFRTTVQLSDDNFNFPAMSTGACVIVPGLGEVNVNVSNFELEYEVNYWDTKLLKSADQFNVEWEQSTREDHKFSVTYPFYDPNTDTNELVALDYQYEASHLQDNSVTARQSEREGLKIRYTGELLVFASVYGIQDDSVDGSTIEDISMDIHNTQSCENFIEETIIGDVDVSE